MGVLIILIGLFIGFTGGYAIITALNQMGKSKADSSLETKFFKFNAPVGFTYGIVAFFLVFLLIRYYDIGSQKTIIESQTKTLDSFKNVNEQLQLNHTEKTNTSIKETFSYSQPKSIWGGKVLIEANTGGFNSDPYLKFTGIIGTSKNDKGPFDKMVAETDVGRRFYFMSKDSVVWGGNTIGNLYGLTVEIYKEH